jgi:hypothetical protein
MFRIMAHAQTQHQLMASHQPYTIQKWLNSLAPQGVFTTPTPDECQLSVLHSSSKGPGYEICDAYGHSICGKKTHKTTSQSDIKSGTKTLLTSVTVRSTEGMWHSLSIGSQQLLQSLFTKESTLFLLIIVMCQYSVLTNLH